MRTFNIFGIELNDLSHKDLFQLLEHEEGYNYIVTPNVDHVIQINRGEELGLYYGDAFARVCDSRILQKLASFVGVEIRNILAGSDLTRLMFTEQLTEKDKVFIVGPPEEDIQKLCELFPKLNIGFCSPPFGFINKPDLVEECLEAIENADADYIFLAVGAPRQEKLAFLLKERLNKGTALCIGASIDFLTGKQVRAPQMMQQLRIEWMYRLMSDPKRLFKRYCIDGLDIGPIFFSEFKKRRQNKSVSS